MTCHPAVDQQWGTAGSFPVFCSVYAAMVTRLSLQCPLFVVSHRIVERTALGVSRGLTKVKVCRNDHSIVTVVGL